MEAIINSNLYIAIQGSIEMFTKENEAHIYKTFKEIFETSKKVSDVSADDYREIIHSIITPLFKNDKFFEELYSDLEILLEELKEYNPHFTQFGGEN